MTGTIKQRSGAFSLVEVVIAVGLFALSILAIVGLLGPILESIRESEETEIVSNLNELIRAELERIPFEDIEVFSNAPNDIEVLYANRDLSIIGVAGSGGSDWTQLLSRLSAQDPERDYGLAETFFRIELRNSAAFPFAQGVPAGQETTRTFHIRVYWPIYRRTGPGPADAEPAVAGYGLGDNDPTGLSELRQMNFFTTIRRK